MSRKNIAGVVLAGGLLVAAGAAQAGGYLGLGLGSAGYDYDDVDNSTAIKIFGGYLVPESMFGVEAAYVDLGEADIESVPGWTLQMEGFYVAGVLNYTMHDGGLGFFGRLGAYSLETTIDAGFADTSDDSTGLTWALGLSYSLPTGLGFRAELESYEGVEDFADDASVGVISLGIQYNF